MAVVPQADAGAEQSQGAPASPKKGSCKVCPCLSDECLRKCPCMSRMCCAICCAVSVVLTLLVIIAAFVAAGTVLTDLARQDFIELNEAQLRENTDPALTSASLVYNVWWPGCLEVNSLADFDTGCGEPCFSASLMREMEAFNRANPGVVVHYPSRGAEGVPVVSLGAWWLPPTASNGTALPPIIVLQHGFKANSNSFRGQLGAFMLRKLGFGVLVTNFRDHGYSNSSGTGLFQWGNAVPLDVLGGWDYAVTDPDGLLGGARGADKVGLMGFSKGGFAVSNAFGLEGQVPAAWTDGAAYTPEGVFGQGAGLKLEEMGLGGLAGLLIGPVYDKLTDIALEQGVDLNRYLPEKTLPLGPDTRRPYMMVQNDGDTTVPPTEHAAYKDLLAGLPEKYAVQTWLTTGTCRDNDHCVDHLIQQDTYLEKLCQFWHAAFGMSTAGRCATRL